MAADVKGAMRADRALCQQVKTMRHGRQLTFEVNSGVWILFGSPGICLLVLLFGSQFFSVIIVALWVAPKDVTVVASIFNVLR